MKNFQKCTFRAVCCALIMIFLCPFSLQARGPQPRGLHGYRASQSAVKSSVSLYLQPLYLFNDMDVFRFALQDPKYATCMGWGGVLAAAYSHPIGARTLMRTSFALGYYHGDASIRQTSTKGHYNGTMGELAVGVEYFPWAEHGLYMYAGAGININDGTLFPEQHSGRSLHLLPMAQVELGYKIDVRDGWKVGMAATGHIGLVDTTWGNMDDYGDYMESYFPDGYVSFSFLVSYTFGSGSGRYSSRCNCILWN